MRAKVTQGPSPPAGARSSTLTRSMPSSRKAAAAGPGDPVFHNRATDIPALCGTADGDGPEKPELPVHLDSTEPDGVAVAPGNHVPAVIELLLDSVRGETQGCHEIAGPGKVGGGGGTE